MGYVLAIVGVGIALVVMIVGSSTIAALGHGVPKELWAIGGALSGALVGILAPSPRTRDSTSEKTQLKATQDTIDAAKEAAQARAETEKAAAKGAEQSAAQALREVEHLGEAAIHEAAAPPATAGSSGGRAGSPPPAPGDVSAKYKRALAQALDTPTAMTEAARQVKQAALDATNGPEQVRLRVQQTEQAAQARADAQAHSSQAIYASVDKALGDVQAVGDRATQDLIKAAGIGIVEPAGANPALTAALSVVHAERRKLLKAAGEAAAHQNDDALAAVQRVHEAAHNAAAKAAASAKPSQAGWSSGLKAIITEPKLMIPLIILAITLALGVLLGLGVIHPMACQAEAHSCAYYATVTQQIANVMISLAAAAVGALIGMFATASDSPSKPASATKAA